MAKERACETEEETARRKDQNQASMVKHRACGTELETAQTLSVTEYLWPKRASETEVQTAQRKEQIRACMAKKRALTVPLENWFSAEGERRSWICVRKTNCGPLAKYTKASSELLEQVFSAEHN